MTEVPDGGTGDLTRPQLAALAEVRVAVPLDRQPDGSQVGRTVELAGRTYAVALSSPELLAAHTEEPEAAVLVTAGRLAAQLPEGTGLLLDPGEQGSVVVPAGATAQLARAAELFPPGHVVRTGEPEDEPHELLSALSALLPSAPGVRSARRVWYQVQGQRPRLLLVLDGDEALRADGLEPAVAVLQPGVERVAPPFAVQAVALDRSDEGLRRAVEGVPPFWTG